MVKDYHMHPTVLQDRSRFQAFARKAMEEGIEELCITDHMPLSVSRAGDRIPAGRVEEYCSAVRSLAKEYEGKLSVRLGIEIDYHPKFKDEIEAVLKAGEYDFVIGATHLHVVQNEIFKSPCTYNEFAEAALENSMYAAWSGYFDAIAHLDFFRWVYTQPHRFPLVAEEYSYERHIPAIEKVLDAIRDQGMYLEINPHQSVLQNNFASMYPEEGIMKMALEKGLRFSYGSDAHEPEHVGGRLKELRAHPVYGRGIASWEKCEKNF